MKKKTQITIYMLFILFAVGCEKEEEAPIACFDVNSTVVKENQAVSFTNCSENATAYYWEFGDETTSINYHASHAFNAPGEYLVTLTVFKGEQNDRSQITITVEEDPLPVACFTVASSSVLVGEELAFFNCSQNAESHHWDFGDGNTSSEKEPVHIFFEPGDKVVELTVENEYGQDSMSMMISVADADVFFFDGFENYEDFSLSFGDWTQIDNDGSPTWGLSATSFPNSGYVGSFIIFNPSQTDPPVDEDERFTAYNGQKYAACFAARNSANDDWLISPDFLLEEGVELSLAAKSYSDAYGPDLFVVQLLDENDDVIWLSPENEPINPPMSWTSYSYDLSEYAGHNVRIQIGCLSDDAVALFIDDIAIKGADGKVLYRQNFEAVKPLLEKPLSSPSLRR